MYLQMPKLLKPTNLFLITLLSLFLFISCTQTSTQKPEPISPEPIIPITNPPQSPVTIKDLEIKTSLKGHYFASDPIKQVIYSPSNILGSISRNQVHLFDGLSGKLLKTLSPTSNSTIDKAFFSPNGQHLVISDQDGGITLWEVESGQLKHTLYKSYQYSYIEEVRATLVFSPDSKSIAIKRGSPIYEIFDDDKFTQVDLWSVQNGSLIRSYTGLSPYHNTLVFSPDGTTLSAVNRIQEYSWGPSSYELKMWQVTDGKLLNVISNAAARLTYSPDGKYFAANDGQGRINVWDTTTWKLLYTLSEETSNIPKFVFSPDSKTIVSGSSNGTFRVWDIKNGQMLKRISDTPYGSKVSYIAFSKDGKSLYAGMSNEVILWQVSDWKQLYTKSEGKINSAIYNSDNSLLITGNDKGNLEYWDITNAQLQKTIPVLGSPRQNVHSVAYSPDGKLLASLNSDDNEIIIWNLSEDSQSLLPNAKSAYTLEFSHDGELLISKTWNGGVKLWNVGSNQLLLDLKAGDFGSNYGTSVTSVALSPDSQTFVVSTTNNEIVFYNTSNGTIAFPLTPAEGTVIGFSDNNHLVTTFGSSIKVWDITSQELVRVIGGENSSIKHATLSPDRTLLASNEFSNSSSKRIINIWNISTGDKVSTILSPQPYYKIQMSISPDNQTLITPAEFSNPNYSMNLWNIATSKLVHTFGGHFALPDDKQTQPFSFGPDGINLAVGSGHRDHQNTITIYGLPNNKPIFLNQNID